MNLRQQPNRSLRRRTSRLSAKVCLPGRLPLPSPDYFRAPEPVPGQAEEDAGGVRDQVNDPEYRRKDVYGRDRDYRAGQRAQVRLAKALPEKVPAKGPKGPAVVQQE